MVTGALLFVAAFVWPQSEGLSGAVVGAVTNYWLDRQLVAPSRRSTDSGATVAEDVPDIDVTHRPAAGGEP